MAADPGGASADHVCDRGTTHVTGRQARLVVLDDHLWGCLRGHDRVLVAHPADFGGWRMATLAGRYAAVELTDDSQECSSREVRVVDLRSGRDWTKSADAAGTTTCGGADVSDLVLRSDGLVAFIAGGEVLRWSADRAKVFRLDPGPKVEPRSLSFARGGLRWRTAGQVRQAALPGRRGRRAAHATASQR